MHELCLTEGFLSHRHISVWLVVNQIIIYMIELIAGFGPKLLSLLFTVMFTGFTFPVIMTLCQATSNLIFFFN